MNKTLTVKYPGYCLLVRRVACWLITTWVLLGLIPACQAQTNRHLQTDQVYTTTWHNPREVRSMYSIRVEALQHQVKCLLKPLSHLSVVDPTAYSLLQDNLHAYLRQLDQEGADYADSEIYRGVQLHLLQFEERIKVALAESRRIAHEEEATTDNRSTLSKGAKVTVRPYTLVFTKPDYRSALRHIILPKESVTILRDEGTYCQVKCALYKGYLSKGMIVGYVP